MFFCKLGLVAFVWSCSQVGLERIHVRRQFGNLAEQNGQIDPKSERDNGQTSFNHRDEVECIDDLVGCVARGEESAPTICITCVVAMCHKRREEEEGYQSGVSHGCEHHVAGC